MNKKHQQAFNKAFLTAIKNNKKRKLLYNSKTRTHDIVVPVATIIKAFRPFINMVEKDLKIGRYAKKNQKSK